MPHLTIYQKNYFVKSYDFAYTLTYQDQNSVGNKKFCRPITLVSNIAITLGPRPCTTVLGVVHGRGWVSIWLHDKQLTYIEEGALYANTLS